MRVVLPTLLLLAQVGCAKSSPRESRPSHDAATYLEHRYGESFEVFHTSNESNAGVGLVNRFRFRARPTAAPELEFGGSISYRDDGTPTVRDDYACDGVARWLPDSLTGHPAEQLELQRVVVRCTPALPAHPTPHTPLPVGTVSAELALDVFDDGVARAVMIETATTVGRHAAALGVRVTGTADLYPASLRALRERTNTSVVAGRRPVESLTGYRRARVDLADATVTELPRLVAVETEIVEALRSVVPTAQVDARVTPVTAPAFGAGADTVLGSLPPRSLLHVDIRVAGLESIAEDVPQLRDAAARLLGSHRWELRVGRYGGLDGPAFDHPDAYERGWICLRAPVVCSETQTYLFGPGAR